MTTYISLIRGINVGGKNILPMKELIAMLNTIGCKDIKTYIQSGNVVFNIQEKDKLKLAKLITLKISDKFGFETKVLIIEPSELRVIIDNNPYETTKGKFLHFFFADAIPLAPKMEKLNELKTNSEQFKLFKNVFYLYAPDGIGRSKLAANLERCLGVSGTARNWNTICKLLSLAEDVQQKEN